MILKCRIPLQFTVQEILVKCEIYLYLSTYNNGTDIAFINLLVQF
jgi:hypothetical protein